VTHSTAPGDYVGEPLVFSTFRDTSSNSGAVDTQSRALTARRVSSNETRSSSNVQLTGDMSSEDSETAILACHDLDEVYMDIFYKRVADSCCKSFRCKRFACMLPYFGHCCNQVRSAPTHLWAAFVRSIRSFDLRMSCCASLTVCAQVGGMTEFTQLLQSTVDK